MFATGNSSRKCKGYSLVLYSHLPISHGIWLHTHKVCPRYSQGTGKHPGYCSLLLTHDCVSKSSIPDFCNGPVLRHCQQTCNFSFLSFRAQKVNSSPSRVIFLGSLGFSWTQKANGNYLGLLRVIHQRASPISRVTHPSLLKLIASTEKPAMVQDPLL